MPAPTWSRSRDEAGQRLNERDPAAGVDPRAGALLFWATESAESVFHAGDQYARLFNRELDGYHPDMLDVAYARWGTASAITALDLCAAALARAYAGWTDPHRHVDLRHFLSSRRRGGRLADQVPEAVEQWLLDARQDPDYELVLAARNPFVHGVLVRNISVHLGGPPQSLPGRVSFAVGGHSYSTRDLLQRSGRIAHEYIERLLDEILDGTI